MQPFRLCNLVVLAALVYTGAAIKCYDGLEENYITANCSGSCLRSTVTQEGNKLIELSCYPTLEEEGCRDMTIDGFKDEVCFCNTDYCNASPTTTASPTTASPTTTTTASPTASPTTAGAAIKCYDGLEGDHITVDCPGSCLRSTVTREGNKLIELSCHPTLEEEGCGNRTIDGFPDEVCFCNTDYCNTSPTTAFPTTAGATIKCYEGFLETQKTIDCKGSCTRATDRDASRTYLGCYQKRLPQTCAEVFVLGSDMEVCLCNSDYCNTSPTTASPTTASPTTVSPTTSSPTTAGAAIKCYEGSLGTQKIIDCQGSCTRATDRNTSKTYLGCNQKQRPRSCAKVETSGKDMDVCFCNSDYCNAVPHSSSSTSLPSLLILVPLLFSFVMSLVF